MFIDEFICSCTRYIAERRCADGDYCFYRLNESNPADTFFALDALRLLGAAPDDPDTARWLLEWQGESGYYVLLSLAALGVRPERDPLPWLFSVVLSAWRGGTRPVESTSLLTRPYVLTGVR